MGTERLRRALGRPVAAAGLSALRVMLGLLYAGSAARFLARGWHRSLLAEPGFHFRYPGWEWVPVPSDGTITLLYGLMVVAGLLVAAGLLYRVAAVALFLAFTWVELVDVATYLNHYYLLSLVALLLVLLPLHRHGSLDARLGLVQARSWQPAWALVLLRAQVAVVYVYAGAAKLNADWLLHGEPLHTWLRTRTELPLVGSLMDEPWLALAMSWAGCLYDLSIPLWLSWRRTRALAWIAVVLFHLVTWLLFPIGVFPWAMIVLSTVFWDPGWAARRAPSLPSARPAGWGATVLVVGWLAFQLLFPLRSWLPLYSGHGGGEVRWHEQGFRFSWRVMLTEKRGLVEYRVVDPVSGRQWPVDPGDELTELQLRELSTQPDLIAQYGRHLAARWREEQGLEVEVYAESWASLNGRPTQRLVDPRVDLAGEELAEGWILPLR